MSKLTIGEFLATQRKLNGYTQQQVADKLGVSNRTLSSWEQGRTYPDILILPAIAELYGISVDDITRGTRSAESSETEEKDETSNYIDARNAHTASSVWISGACLASPVFTAMAFIGAYFSAIWAITLCAVLAGLTEIAGITAIIYFNRSALNRTGAYLPNKDKGGVSDKCSLAVSLNTCRTLAVAGWAYLLPIAVYIILVCLSYAPAAGFRIRSDVEAPAYAMLFPLMAGVGVLAASVIYKNIAVKKYGDGRQNILQRHNRVLFLICLTAVLPVLASVICVSEIRVYDYYTEVYSAPREEFLRTFQTVNIAEPMASLYGVEEGEVFIDIQSAHVGNQDYCNEDGYWHIMGNMYSGRMSTGKLTIYYRDGDGNYNYVTTATCFAGLGDVIEEYYDLEGNLSQLTTVAVEVLFLNDELISNSLALDKQLIVGTPCYDEPPFHYMAPFRPVVYYNHYTVRKNDGIETLGYRLRCDYFLLVMPIACIVSAVSLATGCAVYFIKRKRIY